ncbi:MAG: hypothetical protein IPJ71_10635 [Bdellovibrionales bacterium]|nr:hypothetical protein [Bdellovibrionales bacterium]
MNTDHQTTREDLPASSIPDLAEYESILNSYQDYMARKGFEPRKVRHLKSKSAHFIRAIPVMRKLGITPDKFIECLEIKFSEISKESITVTPGHLSSEHAEDYVTEVMKRSSGSSLVAVEQAAKLRAAQNKFIKPEDDPLIQGLMSKIKAGKATPWQIFYYKERFLQVRGELSQWIVDAETKMREVHNGKKN